MSFLESPFNPMATFDSQSTMRSISTIDPKLSRTHYYDGRLLKASDLIRDQFYLDERLREVGRVLGQGIVRGLDIKLTTDKKLIVAPGLAVSPSGRVLELEKTTLEINLLDSAKLYELNPGFHYLTSGLYAVVIQYAEKGEGSAEIYPKDLESERGFHFNAYAEGVEFTLVKLQVNLPLEKLKNLKPDEIAVYSRSALVQSLLVANPGQPVGIGDDAVALGLLAIEFGSPQWVDKGLLRRPFRHAHTLNYLQTDLYNHYEELLQSVLTVRGASVAKEQFLAKQYFTILPPMGSIPKGSVDPINGYQHYFPEHFEVSISPVRADDVDSLLQQSMALEPIDLRLEKDVDIMIAVVLDDVNFAFRARQLQHRLSGDNFVMPPHLDDVMLDNTDASSNRSSTEVEIWTKLWASAKQIFYVRRPVRVAETQVSAVVLATGNYQNLIATTSLPKAAESLEDEIDALAIQLAEKNNRISQLTNELNKPLDQKLKEAKAAETKAKQDAEQAQQEETKAKTAADEAKAIAATAKEASQLAEAAKEIAVAEKNQSETAAQNSAAEVVTVKSNLAASQEKLKEALAEIKRLKETGGEVDSAELEKLKKQLNDARQQLADIKVFLMKLWSNEKITLENINILAELRSSSSNEANGAAEKVMSMVQENSELQSSLMQHLILMPAQFDDLNWPSLQAIYENQLSEKTLSILAETPAEQFPDMMLKIANEFSFSDELQSAWKKRVTRLNRFTPSLSPEALANIKVLKLNQLMPAALDVSEENRALIKEIVSADSSLLKPLSQLKVLIEQSYETVLWSSVAVILEAGKIVEFVEFVMSTQQKSLPLGLSIAASNNRFKLSVAVRNAWAEIDFS